MVNKTMDTGKLFHSFQMALQFGKGGGKGKTSLLIVSDSEFNNKKVRIKKSLLMLFCRSFVKIYYIQGGPLVSYSEARTI